MRLIRTAMSASPRARSRRCRVLMITISTPPAPAEIVPACLVRNRLIEVVAVTRTGAEASGRSARARLAKRATAAATPSASRASAAPASVGISRLAPRRKSCRPRRCSKALSRRAVVASLSPSRTAARASDPLSAMAWKMPISSQPGAARSPSRRDAAEAAGPIGSAPHGGKDGRRDRRHHGGKRLGAGRRGGVHATCPDHGGPRCCGQPGSFAGQPGRNAGLAGPRRCRRPAHRSISSPAKAARSWMKRKRASGLLPISRSTVSEVSSRAS